MEQQSLAARIERELAEQAGLYVAVEETDGGITLSGRVDSAEAIQAAKDIVARLAPGRRFDNNLEVEEVLPLDVRDFALDEPGGGDLPESVDEIEAAGNTIDPDFTDQPLVTSPVEMAGEASTTLDEPDESETVMFPPTDPVITTDDQGEIQVLGGFSPTSGELSEVEVEPSALDDQPGDEALVDAIRRELREDALTTDLTIHVSVRRGVAHLRGTVPTLDDAENAEEVASRVPGVREVVEELEVADL